MNISANFIMVGLFSVILLDTTYAQEIPHTVINYDCNVCHSPQSWKEVRFDHDQTDFPLEGKHRGTQCVECHQLNDFAKAEANCIACHTDVHQAKLGLMCDECHSPIGWSDLNFIAIHSNSTFPLTGAHLNLDCKACHVSEIENEFTSLNSDCYNCHEQDFINNPNAIHDFLRAGSDCQQCHTTSAWQPAGFRDHDRFFPIFSGAHASAWSSCGDCHISPGDFQMFSCLTCHEHNQQRMDNEHDEVSGYVYESNACLSCHPRGSGEE